MKAPKIEAKLRNGVWIVRYSYNGKRPHYSLKTSDNAEKDKAVQRIQYEIENGIHRPLIKLFFENLISEYLDWSKQHKAESSYLRDEISSKYLLEFFRGRRIDQLKLIDGETYQSLRKEGKLLVPDVSRKKTYSTVSINRECRLLISMFNKAIGWEYLDRNPFRFLKLFKELSRVRYVKAEEWPRLLSACKLAFRNFVIFARFTGMRLSEILNCRWVDIDWSQSQISVTKCKNNLPRTIPLNPLVRTMLDKLRTTATSEFIFPGTQKDRESEAKYAFRKACRVAGIENLRFHDLRHTFASDMINAGVGIGALMGLMGHKTITTTMRYAHLYPQHIRAAIEKTYNYYLETGPNLDQIEDDE
jgi:integrase